MAKGLTLRRRLRDVPQREIHDSMKTFMDDKKKSRSGVVVARYFVTCTNDPPI